jgi:beta-lactam-binding protein with PASTA domain
MTLRRPKIFLTCGLAALAFAACGESADTAEDDAVAKLEARLAAAEDKAAEAERKAEDASAAVGEAPAADTSAEEEYVSEEEPASSGGAGCIEVPDVVGKDHQLAQDTMQAAGLYMLLEEDATGQGRMLVLDRNWTTVEQRPAAGECVSEDTEIMLSAKKDGE